VLAAASLRGPLEQLRTAWLAERPDAPLRISFDSSSLLAAQIEQGAPADVFVSADTALPRRLAGGGHASGPVVPFARDRLVIVAPAGTSVLQDAHDLAAAGLRIVSAADGVPLAAYTAAALEKLAASQADPSRFRDVVAANIVSLEENAAAVLAKVALGEGDAALVYATQASAAQGVRIIELPDDARVTATYAAVAVAGGRATEDGLAFVGWLSGPSATSVLASAGLEVQ
jgi:molybdate transport system substrate-binding protein